MKEDTSLTQKRVSVYFLSVLIANNSKTNVKTFNCHELKPQSLFSLNVVFFKCFHELLCCCRNRPDISTNHWMYGYPPRPIQVLYNSKNNVTKTNFFKKKVLTHCFCFFFRITFPIPTEDILRRASTNASQNIQFWTSVCSALCGCVNNPQNGKNQLLSFCIVLTILL